MPADQIIAVYAAQMERLRAYVLAYVEGAWTGLGSYDRSDIDRFVRSVVPVVSGGQLQVAALTDSYLAHLEADTFGEAPRLTGIPREVVSDESMRGVPADEVYARVGPTVWKGLKDGKSFADAVAEGLQRLTKVAASDLQLAKTHASRYSMSRNERVVGYMRVTHGKTCGLCIVASTQRYRREDLSPMHPACDCSVEPIYGVRDTGQVLNADRLDRLHGLIEERFGTSSASARTIPGAAHPSTGKPLQYRDVLIEEHGELGPVLTVRGQRFTGPDDI